EALQADVRRLYGFLSRYIGEVRSRHDALRAQVVCAVDFPEDEVDCLDRATFVHELESLTHSLDQLVRGQRRQRVMQNGACVVLVGAVNAGKSSLLNALLGRERALVTAIPGTTRDFLEEFCDLDGVPVRLTDTAGLREKDSSLGPLDPIEELGIRRGQEKCADADCLLLVLDGTDWTNQELQADVCPRHEYATLLKDEAIPKILVWNKRDEASPALFPPRWASHLPACEVSAKFGDGLDRLVRTIQTVLLGNADPCEEQVSCNTRQAIALEKASSELLTLTDEVRSAVSYDLCAVRLDYIATLLGDVIGVSTSQDVLNAIFSHFCIGK
ncbi:MAG: 50S ribosome-binding GTPase, partial [Desulfovibrio sp.]|nr:50S ribosome-binding GTPase [Desulfovibrio sp.]